MTRAELLALAERVEASEPDRDLEAEVWVAVFDPDSRSGGITIEEVWHGGPTREVLHTERGSCWADECKPPVGRYMSSIDAAASLVPEGCEVKLVFHTDPAFHARAAVHRHVLDGSVPSHRGPTPAIALTAAALRARAEEAGDE